jgi:hypothetical protein
MIWLRNIPAILLCFATIVPLSQAKLVEAPSKRRYLEQMQAVPIHRIQVQETFSHVSLRLPTAIPQVMKVADQFILKGSAERYELCPATAQGDCDRFRAYGFQQFIARKGFDFYSPQQLPSNTLYHPIELAHQTPGIYFENCKGQTCVSVVQWKQDGMLYEVQAKYREQSVLVKIANSAIESEPISTTFLQTHSQGFH